MKQLHRLECSLYVVYCIIMYAYPCGNCMYVVKVSHQSSLYCRYDGCIWWMLAKTGGQSQLKSRLGPQIQYLFIGSQIASNFEILSIPFGKKVYFFTSLNENNTGCSYESLFCLGLIKICIYVSFMYHKLLAINIQ